MSKPITIIKIGTGVLTRVEDGTLDEASLVRLVTSVAELAQQGRQCVLVSSGAVGAGVSALGLKSYPRDAATRQGCAAVGQTRLMHAYESIFQKFSLNVAQILLSAKDLEDKFRSKSVQGTLERLLEMGTIIPIINENDTVAAEGQRVDNDTLASHVARMLDAELLLMLTTVNGLLGSDGCPVEMVDDIATVEEFVKDEQGKFSTGGMRSKLKAVKVAVDAGIETVIASGKMPEQISPIVHGALCGTRFAPKALKEPVID